MTVASSPVVGSLPNPSRPEPAAGGATACFGRRWRLLRRGDFLRVQERGKKLVSDHFLVFSIANGLDHPRLGITVSRKVGNAVIRNRVKRLVREVFRTEKQSFPAGRDLVVIAHPSAVGLSLAEVRSELLAFCRRSRGSGGGK
ncbi:MAG: ribonuclease P protein component [Deltaproteobacteria bacterium]|nr:ribonuclease P protein component [Deltaproteobacteria bacterium]